MTNYLISTVRRHISVSETSGYLYTLDFENQLLLQRTAFIEPPYREFDNNPRGGLRGCRGISLNTEQILIANASYIYRFDAQWNQLGEISHPSCNAIHDILLENSSVWLASARNDLCVHLDFAGNILEFINFRDHALAFNDLGWHPPKVLNSDTIFKGLIDFRDPRTNDDETYNRAHVNSICSLKNGDKLISLGLVLNDKFAQLLKIKKWLYQAGCWQYILSINRKIRNILKLGKGMHTDLIFSPPQGKSAVIRLAKNGILSLCLAIDNVTTPSHSLLPLPDDTVIYLNTTLCHVIHFDSASGVILSSTKVTDGFLRGAALLPDGNIIMGSNGKLIVFNLKELKISNVILLTSDPNESVYDIKELPNHFALPPLALAERTSNVLRCTG